MSASQDQDIEIGNTENNTDETKILTQAKTLGNKEMTARGGGVGQSSMIPNKYHTLLAHVSFLGRLHF